MSTPKHIGRGAGAHLGFTVSARSELRMAVSFDLDRRRPHERKEIDA